jgi:DmsE family decaheme c-type cytochrome
MTVKSALKHLHLMIMVATLGGILAGSHNRLSAQNPVPKGKAAQGESINNEDCAMCHDEVAKGLEKNRHAVLEKSSKYGIKNSCEKCHGSGQDHIANDGDKTKILSFKGGDRAAYNKQCLGCHGKTEAVTGYAGSEHAKGGLACSDCHGIHGSAFQTKLLKAKANDLCLGCHTEQKGEFSRPYHHRVQENAMRCIDCHQPHGGMERHQVRGTASGETPCMKCHAEKSGPFIFEHAPMEIRECGACHESHGSNYTKMLKRSNIRQVCLECHTRSANVLTSQPPAFHDLRSARYNNCTTCHVKMHGSNSSSLFLR